MRKDLDDKEIANLYESGLNLRQIASRHNCSIGPILTRLKKNHIQRREAHHYPLGEKHPRWKGGKSQMPDGYIRVLCRGHHRANPGGYVREHILVWENTHGKTLSSGYVIHHLNGIKNDNRPDNLIATLSSEHVKLLDPYKKRIRQLEDEVIRLKQLSLMNTN